MELRYMYFQLCCVFVLAFIFCSNFLYQGFAEKYLLGIYLHSKAWNQKENWGVSVLLSEQWSYAVDLFALKSDFCIIRFL